MKAEKLKSRKAENQRGADVCRATFLLYCFSAFLISAAACAAAPRGASGDERAEWERLEALPVAVISPASSVAGERWVVTGGVRTDMSAGTEVQVFDFGTQRWAMGEALRAERFGHGQATLADGRVLVVGGRAITPEQRLVALDSVELIEADGDGVSAGPPPDHHQQPSTLARPSPPAQTRHDRSLPPRQRVSAPPS
ncbi:MAG: hypothetical protein AAF078_08455 [Planctomycetota bacterium]